MRAVRKGNFLLVLFPILFAISGCQTLQNLKGTGSGDGKSGFSLKDAPARKRQPKTLDDLIEDEFAVKAPPRATRQSPDNRMEPGTMGANRESAGLATPSVHVESDIAPDDFDPTRAKQLPDFLESPKQTEDRPPLPELKNPSADFNDTQPPEIAFDDQKSLTTGSEEMQTEPEGTVLPDAAIQPANAAQTNPATPPSPDQNPFADTASKSGSRTRPGLAAPKTGTAAGNLPASPNRNKSRSPRPGEVPVIRLQAKTNEKGASAVLSDEISLLLGNDQLQQEFGNSEDEVHSALPGNESDEPARLDGRAPIFDPSLKKVSAQDTGDESAQAIVGSIGDGPENGIQDATGEGEEIPGSHRDAGFKLTRGKQNPPSSGKTDSLEGADHQAQRLDWENHLVESIELLQARLNSGEVQPDERELIRLQLMKIVNGEKVDSIADSRLLPASRRAFWQSQLAAIEVMINGMDNEDGLPEETRQRRRATLAAGKLETAAAQLSANAELRIDNAIFCNQVRGFGQFTAVPARFYPKQQTLIYCEINNYALQEIPGQAGSQDSVIAEIRGSYIIHDENNRVVHQHQYQPVRDSARWRRKDFYMYFPVTLPELRPGSYRLQLSLEDRMGQKTATVSPELEFQVVPREASPPRNEPVNRTATDFPAPPIR